MFDVLIKNGTVVDGSGKARQVADVGISGDRITLVGQAQAAQAHKTIDATGKIVCPGFVDPHSHADLSLMRPNQVELLEPLVRQGITTFVGGNCGMAMAPIPAKNRASIENYLEIFTRLDFERDIQWKSMGEYFDKVEAGGLLLNAAILAPHGLLRLTETGSEMRHASDEEVENMANALDQALDEGAVGLSTGLQYVPGSQSDTRELLRLGAVCKKHDAIFTSHLRSYSNTLGKAIDEVIEVAETNDIRAQISHLFWVPDYGVFGPVMRKAIQALARLSKWWTAPIPIDGPMRQRIEQMMQARRRGVALGVDIMPTTSGFTHILAFFPPWSLAGTRPEVLARLKDPEMRRRIRYSIEHGKMVWPHTGGDSWTLNLFRLMGWDCARIMSVASASNKRLEGMNLTAIARERGVHPFDAACDLLLEENGHVLVFESMAEPDDAFTERSSFAGMKHPDMMISTDSILMGGGKPSSLFYGCYPHFLSRFVRQKEMLSLETAIRKSTGLAAEHFCLKGRGKVEEKAFADIVIFDFNTLASKATFLDPAHFPVGIEQVFINGHLVLDNGVFTPDPRPGRLLRRTQ